MFNFPGKQKITSMGKDNTKWSNEMPQKKIQFKQAKEFAKENGYIFAVYEKQTDGNFHKIEDALWDTPIEDNTEIMVKTTGAATDFNEFTTVDGQYCFRLHNNFNVPEIIPVIKR